MADNFFQLDFTAEQINEKLKGSMTAKEIKEYIEKYNKGDSAYQVAVKNGYEGTESEWLESLIGGSPDTVKNAINEYLELNPLQVPVTKVNGKEGAVQLGAADFDDIYSKDDVDDFLQQQQTKNIQFQNNLETSINDQAIVNASLSSRLDNVIKEEDVNNMINEKYDIHTTSFNNFYWDDKNPGVYSFIEDSIEYYKVANTIATAESIPDFSLLDIQFALRSDMDNEDSGHHYDYLSSTVEQDFNNLNLRGYININIACQYRFELPEDYGTDLPSTQTPFNLIARIYVDGYIKNPEISAGLYLPKFQFGNKDSVAAFLSATNIRFNNSVLLPLRLSSLKKEHIKIERDMIESLVDRELIEERVDKNMIEALIDNSTLTSRLNKNMIDNALGYTPMGSLRKRVSKEDDLNLIFNDGTYYYYTSSSPINAPFKNAGIILVISAPDRTMQLCARYGDAGYLAYRVYQEGTWRKWSYISCGHEVKEQTDLNDYTIPGIYFFSKEYIPTNIPSANNNGGWLEVLSDDAGHIRQIWYRYGSEGNYHNTFCRIKKENNNGWMPWTQYAMLQYETLPSITTNSNGNYEIGLNTNYIILSARSQNYLLLPYTYYNDKQKIDTWRIRVINPGTGDPIKNTTIENVTYFYAYASTWVN